MGEDAAWIEIGRIKALIVGRGGCTRQARESEDKIKSCWGWVNAVQKSRQGERQTDGASK